MNVADMRKDKTFWDESQEMLDTTLESSCTTLELLLKPGK